MKTSYFHSFFESSVNKNGITLSNESYIQKINKSFSLLRAGASFYACLQRLGGKAAMPRIHSYTLEEGIDRFRTAKEKHDKTTNCLILTGETEDRSLETLSKNIAPSTLPQLRLNLRYAKEITQYVQSKVFLSSNFADRTGKGYTLEQRQGYDKIIKFLRTQPEEIQLCLMAEQHIGNCREMASMGYRYAEGIVPIKKMEIEGGDHVFLIIGEEESSMVICDPWAGAYYPYSVAQQFLRNSKGCFECVGSRQYAIYASVEALDEKKHKIIRCA